jgi:hypothetical protein
VRAAGRRDIRRIAQLAACTEQRVSALLSQSHNLYLVCEREARIVGYAELVPVRTLQYSGLWLESIAVEGETAGSLVAAAIERAKQDAGLDEIGCLVPPKQESLYAACASQGLSKVGEYVTLCLEIGG